MAPTRVLFICSQNRLRSPTAEHLFAQRPGLDCRSAGTNRDAEVPVSLELVEWADAVFVMERRHRVLLESRFAAAMRDKRVIVLEIPDRFRYMDPTLVELLERKVAPFLPG